MTEYRELIRRMTHAINVMDGVYVEWAKLHGVKENIMVLMYVLDDGEFHSQKQISDEWLISKTTLNTIVKECEVQGLLVLKANSEHGREKQICLTEAGRQYAARILEPLYAMEHRAMQGTLQRCSADFVAGLECFCANLKKALFDSENIIGDECDYFDKR